MKISGAALPLLLLLFLMSSFTLALKSTGQGSQDQDDPDLSGPNKCCSNYTKKHVPCDRWKSYHYTDDWCPNRAIVVVTKVDKQFCADPGDKWVQKCLRELPPPDY